MPGSFTVSFVLIGEIVCLDRKGYTLIELIVVLLLVGMMLTLAAPRLRNALLTDDLKGVARKMIGLINNLKGKIVPDLKSNSLVLIDAPDNVDRMIGLINNLRNEAIRGRKDYFLNLDLDANRFWISYGSMTDEEQAVAMEAASSLPPGISIRDVWIREKGKMTRGEARIRFTRRGYTQQSAIHLSSGDGGELTLVVSPFLGKVEVIERYVDSGIEGLRN